MIDEKEFEQLRREVEYLKDRQAILDCINRHARGHDRHDSDLITSAYHPDGMDEHGPDINPALKYADWINPAHVAMSDSNLHNITNHSCEIVGDVAYCESYVVVGLLSTDRKTATVAAGRYIDQLEKRDGEWRIAKRRCVVDMGFTADAQVLTSGGMAGYPMGQRSKDDISYQRPVQINGPALRW